MGVSLAQLVSGNEISVDDLFGKKIAIDAYNWIYQFLTIIRQPDGTPLKDSHGSVTSHLSGLYYRTMKLLEAGAKPVYVFDGKAPEIKKAVTEARRNVRSEAMREWESAIEQKDYEKARKAAQRAATITDDIIRDSKTLLDAMGVPCVQAPGEGEALCSVMAKKGDVFAVSTQDYDTLLFGAPRFIKNLSISGKRKRGNTIVNVAPEMLILEDVLKRLDINHDQLIILGMLVGTDYNPGGVQGYGPKKSLDLVRAKKTLNEVMKSVIWDFPVSAQEIFDFFKNPAGAEYEFDFRDVDEDRVKRIMCDEHEFSEDRIESALRKLRDGKRDQSSLSRWI